MGWDQHYGDTKMSKTCNVNIRSLTAVVFPYGSTQFTPHHLLLCPQPKSAMKPHPNVMHKQYKAAGFLSALKVGMQFQAIEKLNKGRVYLTKQRSCRLHIFHRTVHNSLQPVHSFKSHHTEQQTLNWAEPCGATTFLLHMEDFQKTVASQGLLKALSITNKVFYLHSSSKEGRLPPVMPPK